MLDIDHFKHFNDTFGHQAGDTLLRALGDFLNQRTRGQDVACRYGGEEFVLILSGASADAAARGRNSCARNLKHLTCSTLVKFWEISVSIGTSAFPGHGATGEELVMRPMRLCTAPRRKDGIELLWQSPRTPEVKLKQSLVSPA